MKNDLVLIGAGGHARSCIDVIEQEGKFRIAGLVGLSEEVGLKVLNYEVVGTDDDLSVLAAQFKYALIALGQIGSPEDRIRLYDLAIAAGFSLPTIVASSAYVSPHAKIGYGTIVMQGAIVNSNAVVGSNCIINSKSLIEHDTLIGNNSHISTGAILNGNVSIGNSVFIGSGAIVREQVKIGDGRFIKMGMQVTTDLMN